MMSSFNQSPRHPNRLGFTLVELLVAMSVIGILVGMLAFGVNRVLIRTREFTIQTEMNQLESAIKQFEIQYGFYPPSFRGLENEAFVNGDEAAANLMLSYLNRIAPNHIEGSGTFPDRPIDVWWTNVGKKRTTLAGGIGSDLVFWLSGIAKNKQRPLTTGPADDNAVANAAHNLSGDGIEREVFYDFGDAQALFLGAGEWIQYNQPVGIEIPYLYLDHNHYLPSEQYLDDPMNVAYDGAYCRGGFASGDYDTIVDGSMAVGSAIFKEIFPNPDSYQLITFGLDGFPGETEAPNSLVSAGPAGADNIVNFGNSGPIRLETIILEDQ